MSFFLLRAHCLWSKRRARWQCVHHSWRWRRTPTSPPPTWWGRSSVWGGTRTSCTWVVCVVVEKCFFFHLLVFLFGHEKLVCYWFFGKFLVEVPLTLGGSQIGYSPDIHLWSRWIMSAKATSSGSTGCAPMCPKPNQRTTKDHLDTKEVCTSPYQIAKQLKKKTNQGQNRNSTKTNHGTHNQTKIYKNTHKIKKQSNQFVYLLAQKHIKNI